MSAVVTSPKRSKAGRRFLGLGAGRWVVLVVVWLIMIAIGYSGYQRVMAAPPPAPKGQAMPVQRGSIAASVSTTGSVVAGTAAKLTFKTSGRLAELLVAVGDGVAQGQALARLDTNDLQLQVTQARAQLASAEAKLAQLKQGSRPEELAASEASLASAKAKLAQLQQGSRPEELAASEASLASAQAKLAQLKAAPTEADLQAAQASVAGAKASLASAEAKLADLLNLPKPETVRVAQVQLDKAKNSLWSTQIDRDGACARNVPADACASANVRVATAETEVANQLANLEEVKQPAKPHDIKSAQEALASAQANLESALAKLQQVKAGATAADIAAAQASVDSAARDLALKRAPYNEADVKAAQASVDAAARDLALKRTPYTDADIKAAQATVEQNKVSLALAESNLSNATLVAPFAGTVSTIGINAGEMVGGNAILLVDPKAVRIDATVDESDVAKLEVGQQAEISFDSLAGTRFAGKVIAVAPSGTVQQGVVTYLVSLSVGGATALRPGMTANANIVYAQKNNVLMVPNRAVRAQGRDRVVEVAGEKGNVSRSVRVGMSNDAMTEILEGLTEGEMVVIQATTTAAPRVGGMPAGVPMGGGAGGPVMIAR